MLCVTYGNANYVHLRALSEQPDNIFNHAVMVAQMKPSPHTFHAGSNWLARESERYLNIETKRGRSNMYSTYTHIYTYIHIWCNDDDCFYYFQQQFSILDWGEVLCSWNPWEFECSSFRWNRTGDLEINSPSLWQTDPQLPWGCSLPCIVRWQFWEYIHFQYTCMYVRTCVCVCVHVHMLHKM